VLGGRVGEERRHVVDERDFPNSRNESASGPSALESHVVPDLSTDALEFLTEEEHDPDAGSRLSSATASMQGMPDPFRSATVSSCS
jgi:hypothetical protein